MRGKRAQLGIMLNLIIPIIIIGAFLYVVSLLWAQNTSTYARFGEVVQIARLACDDPGQDYALTEFTVDPGVFIKQIYNDTPCTEHLESLAYQNKFNPDCRYTCPEKHICLCIGRTNSGTYGYKVEDVRNIGTPSDFPRWAQIESNRLTSCQGINGPSLPLVDESLCCASFQCFSTMSEPVFILNNSVGVVDGLYGGYGAFRIEGIFKFYKDAGEDYFMHLYIA